MVSKKDIGKQINLPLKDAFKICFKNIKVRFGRSLITASGIFLGIAFLASILTTAAITSNEEIMKMSKIIVSERSNSTTIWLVTLSLMVCGLGITNSMLMAVTERFREIGTMKCLGALDKFIVELFLIESGLQGLLGSILGCLVGMGGMILMYISSYGVEIVKHLPFMILGKYMLIAIAIGFGLAIIGAIFPAYRAAKMVPADAMRSEI
jgi:predicted lysophospholipase L1 biosynthesis ABC-type transport system permease subunit